MVVVVELPCFAWFSEKQCLLIAMSEGSLSGALTSDLLPVGVVVVNIVVAVGNIDTVVVAAAAVADVGVAAVVVGVGVCVVVLLRPILLFWFLIISPSDPS